MDTVGREVHVQIIPRRREGGMGRDVGAVPERRPGGVPPLDGAAHLTGGPVRGMQVLRQVPGPDAVAVVAHGVAELLARKTLLLDEELVVVP